MTPAPAPDGPARSAAEGPARFAAALAGVEAELDWAEIGRLYCASGGEDFFDAESVGAMREAGLSLASQVGAALAELPPTGPRASLYVGAGVAELAPILCERLVLGRAVVWRNLPGPETDALNRALAAAERELELALPRVEPVDGEAAGRVTPDARVRGAPAARFDHLWLVSVLTDPDAFPALHDALYERDGVHELATGRGDLAAERARAEWLVAGWLSELACPALVTTTDEELALVAPACALRGLTLEVPDTGRLSGVVGDVVRTCRVG